ncbi:hypothetical protein [Pararhodobacter sp.]|uniref:hypothetical protein n=1 Tax=Pararhodobacter sp. TaxID=2127056 RepID=UPI002B001F32|nr:hypothetical protein [Pararhodobacter sp.]
MRADFRMFRADRIRDATPTGQSFRPRRVTLLRDYRTQMAEEDRTAPGRRGPGGPPRFQPRPSRAIPSPASTGRRSS